MSKKQNQSILYSFVLVSFLVFLPGCFSVSNYQTADTLEKDQTEIGLSGNYLGKISEEEDEDSKGSSPLSGSPLIMPELLIRHGIAENLDLGFKISGVISLSGELDVKYRFLKLGSKNQHFSMAIRPAVAASYDNKGDVRLKTGLNLILSQHFSSYFSLYASASCDFRYYTHEEIDGSTYSANFNYSTSIGVSFDTTYFWLRPEATFLYDQGLEDYVLIPGIALGSKF